MDVDIDFPLSFDPLTVFPQAVRASMVKDGKITKHPAGIYLQSIPVDTWTNLAAIPYEEAEQLGYIKVDFLHLAILQYFTDKEQIHALVKISPDWSMLEKREIVEKLIHIHKHFDIVSKVKPKSVEDLADILALIRPGKRHLLQSYLKNKQKIRKVLYQKTEEDDYSFKKSHSVAYALTIVLNMHLIKGKIL